MRFYLLLGLTNLCCFLPLYLLHVRSAPNPFRFGFLADKSVRAWPLRVLYARPHSTDPFRIHFDFTFFVLLAAAAGADGPAVRLIATLLLALGFVEIQYATVMYAFFKRPPELVSDWSLLRSGLKLAQRQVYWMIPAALGVLVVVWLASGAAVAALLALAPQSPMPALLAAAALLPPCLYHAGWHYSDYLWRTVYSPTLHIAFNLRFGALLRRLYSREADHYERYNRYQPVRLLDPPNVVIVCVESYGSIVYRGAGSGSGLTELLGDHEHDLASKGWRFASTFSDAPLFAGGSWLSYASFLYGARIDSGQLYDGLFTRPSNFGVYESLLHVLRRNGYENVLLCPLGGVAEGSVDWTSLDRCFQSDWRVGFDDLGYVGPRINYFGIVRRYAALDQYALNAGYETARRRSDRFSLFFCTLNSHYPWHSVAEASDDWRSLNTPGAAVDVHRGRSPIDRYSASIRYQLDYLLRFAKERTAEAPLIVLFGDHQPPMITPMAMGRQTPVHVLSQDSVLIDSFLEQGFRSTLDLTDAEPRPIRHEGFLSLLMRGMQAAYGTEKGLDLPYHERGAELFSDAGIHEPVQS